MCEDRLCTKHAKFFTSHSYATVHIAHVRTVYSSSVYVHACTPEALRHKNMILMQIYLPHS